MNSMKKWRIQIPLLVVLAVAFGFLLAFQAERKDSTTAGGDMKLDQQDENSIPAAKVIRGSIAKNSSLYASMIHSGIPSGLITDITDALHEVFDLRRSLPGDDFLVEYNPPDTLINFEYETTSNNRYLVRPKEDSLVAIKVYKEFKRFLRCVSGTVEGSLWETMVKMGEDPGLISKLADIFAWEIDFLTDVRAGDQFDFMVEGFEEDGEIAFYGDILTASYSLQGTEHFAVFYQDPAGVSDYYDLEGGSLRKTLLKSPLNYRRVASKFSGSRMHPILKIRRPHYGVDYSARKGTPVVAAGDGRVIFKGWKGDYGNTVIISHAAGYQTYYGHLSGFAKGLSSGRRTTQGKVIGYVGSTGLSTGPHLDYRVKKNGKYIDPLKMNPPSVSPVSKEYAQDYFAVRDELLLTMRSITGEEKVYVSERGENDVQSVADTQKPTVFP